VSSSAVRVSESAWSEAAAALRLADDAVLACHVAPDGDALGSMLALSRVLRAAGVATTCTWGDERWAPPTSYSWLPDLGNVVRPSEVAADPSLLVVLDTSSRDRLGVLRDLPERAGSVVVIDHHAHNGEDEHTRLPGVHVVDPGAAATAVLVEELLRRLDAPIDATTATLLYVGLVTDTGSFQHASTTPAVHEVAARLLVAGVQPDDVARNLWGTRPFAYQRILGKALERASLDESAARGRGVVWTVVAQADLAGSGIGLDEVESVIDVVRSAREADVAVVLKEDVDGTFRVSTRSRGATDVGAVCVALGGGGHRLAAGFTSHKDAEDTVRVLLGALDDAPAP
jgi:bifunctional oligoribonuclease and PAP phosphatase NrnA